MKCGKVEVIGRGAAGTEAGVLAAILKAEGRRMRMLVSWNLDRAFRIGVEEVFCGGVSGVCPPPDSWQPATFTLRVLA